MNKEMICIVCPRGCHLQVEGENTQWSVKGNLCPRGIDYARNEMMHPVKMLTSTIRTNSIEHPRLPVQTSAPIPKDMMMRAMSELSHLEVRTPIRCGEVIYTQLLGLNIDVVATRSINK